MVTVFPPSKANAGPRDTTVAVGQPLQLQATGGVSYSWTPTTWLNNPFIANPVALPLGDIRYTVYATTADGCLAFDTIHVHFYNVGEDIYVPTGFTPNGDGNNDVIRPILIGMQSLVSFRIYNRLGELVFATNEEGKGWDGVYKGKGQDPATFVWYAEGLTYKGELRKKKGYVVLIR